MHELWQTIAAIERDGDFCLKKSPPVSQGSSEKLKEIYKLVAKLDKAEKEDLLLFLLDSSLHLELNNR